MKQPCSGKRLMNASYINPFTAAAPNRLYTVRHAQRGTMQDTQTTFYQLQLAHPLQRAIDEMGFTAATQIQSQAIPLIRQGLDVIGRSQTGTGKTLAFGIPICESILSQRRKSGVKALILCPTRELAMQCCQQLQKLCRYSPQIRPAAIYGGASMDRQFSDLKKANIVIGTPGRIMDHMRRGSLKLDRLQIAVLDEADEMLSMGFREDIQAILDESPLERQTLLFSATMPPEILQLTELYQKDPQLIMVNPKQPTVRSIEQFYYQVPPRQKLEALYLILQYHDPRLAIIFANTKQRVDDITEFLNRKGYQADGLHGDMKQAQRTKVMNTFKEGHRSILVATDVAARGIDVQDVDYVINFDIPQNDEAYIHRIGRTGRAGKKGKAISLCGGPFQAQQLQRTSRAVKAKIQRLELPKAGEIISRKNKANLQTIEEAIQEGKFSYKSTILSLMEKGYTPLEIAAASLQLYLGDPVETKIPQVKIQPQGKARKKAESKVRQQGKNKEQTKTKQKRKSREEEEEETGRSQRNEKKSAPARGLGKTAARERLKQKLRLP